MTRTSASADGVDDLRILMVGTGDFSVPTFERLCGSSYQVIGLVTQPDRPQGRKQELIPARIKVAAQDRGLPIFQPDRINDPESLERIRELRPDLIVTAAYGQILSADLLGIPRLGGINLHGSVLPAYRGAAPVARAIQNGDPETGVTVIRMTPKVDAGGMIAFARTPIEPNESAGELEDRLAALGAPLLVETIGEILDGTAQVIPQDPSRVTKAAKLRKEEGRIDWSKSAQAVHDHIRAMRPWPLADTLFPVLGRRTEPLRLIIHETRVVDDPTSGAPGEVLEVPGDRFLIACGSGALNILTVQIAGKKAMPIQDFLRGHPAFVGHRLGVDGAAS